MLPVALLVLLAQGSACGNGNAAMADAARLARELALPEARSRYEQAAQRGCEEARVASAYLAGLIAARDAYRLGGSEPSLAPVREAEAALASAAKSGSPTAEIARVLLLAASSAAQSERGDMELLLDHARQLERARLASGQPAVPGVSAHELAGDLLLQVHRFEEARAAYRTASSVVGLTPRIVVGLARTAVRLADLPAACDAYESFVRVWGTRPESTEIAEARAFLDEQCPPAPQ